MQIEVFELSCVRSSWFEVEDILERAARYVETLKAVDNTNLEDDAVAIVRHAPHMSEWLPMESPVNHARSKARQLMFAHLHERRIFSKL
ncbi:hypothetical protein LMG24238_00077 [Paraburkholderia sediminicola]|uniref:Uncharacterized protein n=1 Tax=Paraburkholderia sediminicola TaxID=458836 RepID=A0A6J4ZUF6_9BURK|nr:hypothetical protein LMG24238_00077 [Paraburkholderia sediminicola]